MMKIFLLVVWGATQAWAGPKIHVQDCQPESSQDQFLYTNDFKWGYALTEMIEKFKTIYQSEKRLKSRAYYDQKTNKIILPYYAERGGNVVVPESFIENLSLQIEEAFRYKYIDGVFFPDMGHSHFYMPKKKWDAEYASFETSTVSRFYEKILGDEDLRILYHTAEQLKTLKDPHEPELVEDRATQWRFYTRNLLARNSQYPDIKVITNITNRANTMSDLPGHSYWGAGFNLSANKNGCFEYVKDGQKFRYDISLFDLTSSGYDDDYY